VDYHKGETIETDAADGPSMICDIEDACGLSPELVTVGSSGEGVANLDFLLTFGVGQRSPPVRRRSALGAHFTNEARRREEPCHL
jgi:hypothetical protein